MVSKWQMSGSLLGECNCDWGCPCSFDAPPTNGGCRGRVDSGKVYDLALSRIKNPVTGEEEELYLDKPTGFTAKRSELGMSTVARFKAPGLEYDNSGQYAEFSRFSYAGP